MSDRPPSGRTERSNRCLAKPDSGNTDLATTFLQIRHHFATGGPLRLGPRVLDLIRRCSNRSFWTKRLSGLPKATDRNDNDTPRTRRTTPAKLTPQQITELVQGYKDGQTVYALADRFAIHRVTVSAHLHRHGVQLRRQGLSPLDATHAQLLYAEGWSLARIGTRLDVDAHTIRRALKAHGVCMRDTHGRER
jgi:DNA-directed RNA polymerase specialized sigma24 family protein